MFYHSTLARYTAVALIVLLLLPAILSQAGPPLPPPAPVELVDQPADEHSDLSTSDGSIDDDEFAGWIRQYFPASRNMAFVFGTCFGGGMLDDLQSLGSGHPNVFLGAASRHDEEANFYEEGDHPRSFLGAFARAARAHPTETFGQLFGRAVQDNPFGANGEDDAQNAEHPQNASTGSGASTPLYDPNATSHHAILFAGEPEATDRQEMNTMRQALVRAGYPSGNVTVISGGSREQLRQALQNVGGQMNANEQFFFYAADHGSTSVDQEGECSEEGCSGTTTPHMQEGAASTPDNRPQIEITAPSTSGGCEVIFNGESIGPLTPFTTTTRLPIPPDEIEYYPPAPWNVHISPTLPISSTRLDSGEIPRTIWPREWPGWWRSLEMPNASGGPVNDLHLELQGPTDSWDYMADPFFPPQVRFWPPVDGTGIPTYTLGWSGVDVPDGGTVRVGFEVNADTLDVRDAYWTWNGTRVEPTALPLPSYGWHVDSFFDVFVEIDNQLLPDTSIQFHRLQAAALDSPVAMESLTWDGTDHLPWITLTLPIPTLAPRAGMTVSVPISGARWLVLRSEVSDLDEPAVVVRDVLQHGLTPQWPLTRTIPDSTRWPAHLEITNATGVTADGLHARVSGPGEDGLAGFYPYNPLGGSPAVEYDSSTGETAVDWLASRRGAVPAGQPVRLGLYADSNLLEWQESWWLDGEAQLGNRLPLVDLQWRQVSPGLANAILRNGVVNTRSIMLTGVSMALAPEPIPLELLTWDATSNLVWFALLPSTPLAPGAMWMTPVALDPTGGVVLLRWNASWEVDGSGDSALRMVVQHSLHPEWSVYLPLVLRNG